MVAISDSGHATQRIASVFLAVLAMSLAIVLVSLATVGWRVTLTSEWVGPELASSVSLALLTVWLVVAALPGHGGLWPLPAATAFLCLRELDFQNWFFDPGLVRFELLTGLAPPWQKLIGLAVALLIAATVLRLARIGAGPFWRGLRAHTGWAQVMAGTLILLAVVTQLDGLGGDLARAGYNVTTAIRTALLVAEEAGELAFALGLALAADLGLRTRH